MIGQGTTFDRLFADLTDRMGIPHLTDTSPSQRRRVTWAEGEITPEPTAFRRDGEKTIARHAHAHTATVYGDSSADVAQMLRELHGHLDQLVGPPQGSTEPGHDGYKLGKIGALKGGDGTSAQVSRTVEVTLYAPVASQIRPTATVRAIALAVAAPAPDGSEEEGVAWSSPAP